MAYPHEPDPADHERALAALDQYRELVESQPTPIFEELARRAQYDELVDWRPPEPIAATAGEEDHSDPTRFMGAPAEPPVNP